MHQVSALPDNFQLELALHLRNSQCFVESVRVGQYQQLSGTYLQELFGHAREPTLPIMLCGQQIRPPHPLIANMFELWRY